MENKGLTTMSVKKINRNRIYNYIYNKKATYKLQIVQELQMGISTVSQNLKLLEQDGLIERAGFFDSTGGRKAQVIQINRTARIAIGIGIFKDSIHIVAVDLYGNIICKEDHSFSYISNVSYYTEIAKYFQCFIRTYQLPEEKILGVSISTQGIISSNGQSVDYGVLIGNSSMNLSYFQEKFSMPCRLEHDSKAAAAFEAWKHPAIQNAVVLLLNLNLGGALIVNGSIHYGTHMRSGLIEHVCYDADGPLCYCGNHGCLETYCSANALQENAKMNIPDFFQALRKDPANADLLKIWHVYLENLAFAIRNLNLILDGSIIISGYLAPFFTETDVNYLLSKINETTPFPLDSEQILFGTCGQYTSAVGSTLYYLEKFKESV